MGQIGRAFQRKRVAVSHQPLDVLRRVVDEFSLPPVGFDVERQHGELPHGVAVTDQNFSQQLEIDVELVRVAAQRSVEQKHAVGRIDRGLVIRQIGLDRRGEEIAGLLVLADQQRVTRLFDPHADLFAGPVDVEVGPATGGERFDRWFDGRRLAGHGGQIHVDGRLADALGQVERVDQIVAQLGQVDVVTDHDAMQLLRHQRKHRGGKHPGPRPLDQRRVDLPADRLAKGEGRFFPLHDAGHLGGFPSIGPQLENLIRPIPGPAHVLHVKERLAHLRVFLIFRRRRPIRVSRFPERKEVQRSLIRQPQLERARELPIAVVIKIIVEQNPSPKPIDLHIRLHPLQRQFLMIANHHPRSIRRSLHPPPRAGGLNGEEFVGLANVLVQLGKFLARAALWKFSGLGKPLRLMDRVA